MSETGDNLCGLILDVAGARKTAPCLVTPAGLKIAYGDLDRLTAQYANALVASGVGRGDRVAVQVEKSAAVVLLYLACLRMGAVYLPLNTAYTLAELEYFFGDAEPALIVCGRDRRDDLANLSNSSGFAVATLDVSGAGSLADAAGSASVTFETAATSAQDLAAILYTSGTTGRSKGAMLTHRNLISNALTLTLAWGITDKDVLVHALPVFHVHGLFVALNTLLLAGGRMTYLPKFEPAAVLAAIADGATMMMGVPTFYTRLLEDPGLTPGACAGVRLFISGSAPLLTETFSAFEARTGHRILERYGMTETGMNTSNPLNGDRRPGTVGPPLPGVEARIAGADGEILPAGEVGTLEVNGPNVFKGYWRMPEKTSAEFSADGFFVTGDIARIESDGYVTIVGREKDMIITGGLNVYPKEIEAIIDEFDGVDESAVIGIPHPDFGEGVIAVVANGVTDRTVTADQVIEQTRDKLAAFKVPKQVHFVESLPRNTMGKVQKNILRDSHRDAFSKS